MANSNFPFVSPQDRGVIDAVANELDADIIAYAGGIDLPHDHRLIGKIRKLKKRKNVLFSLGTSGGSADSAY